MLFFTLEQSEKSDKYLVNQIRQQKRFGPIFVTKRDEAVNLDEIRDRVKKTVLKLPEV